MSGHSKWATIKRQKGKTDAARGKLFTKIGREIAVAVKAGGPDPGSNARLRDVVAKAKSNNMPNDNITRSIKKASGELGNINYEAITYEGYGPGGTAVIVETLTDNKNRTAGDVRHIFDRCGGSMGTNGCVAYLFKTRGVITYEKKEGMDDDEIMMAALEAGAEDFAADEDCYQVFTAPDSMGNVREALEATGLVAADSTVDRLPDVTVKVDEAALPKVMRMLDLFEDNDDVQNVYHNAELPEEEEE